MSAGRLRRVARAWVGALLGVSLLASIAAAEMYRWRDAAGGVHYADSLESVPAEHRASAVAIGADLERSAPVTIEPTPPRRDERRPLFAPADEAAARSPDLPALMESDLVRAQSLLHRHELGQLGTLELVAGIRAIGGALPRILAVVVPLWGLVSSLLLALVIMLSAPLVGLPRPAFREAFVTALALTVVTVAVDLLVPGSAVRMLLEGVAGRAQLVEQLASFASGVAVIRYLLVDRWVRALGLAIMSWTLSGLLALLVVLAAMPGAS